ncbi:GNAT family N-acetyltransferase [Kribbella antibiotica]|uniref:GNAT family N-acetyltransferase n=1 Tax=Kribbella antibiotica TaxID=190195 RepID=A0A4R4YD93_9ACTN|nr:GNAT family N-acetyltransferase [Kribbella antibiotica]TDD42625.1 GNAT family N-acetyltransferase [Kribbella antibiotica]
MIARVTRDPAAFQDLVFPYLQRDPVLNSQILTNVADRVRGIMNDPEPPVFVSVHDDADEVVGAVICTALRGVQLQSLPTEFVPPVAEILVEAAPWAIAVIGPAESAWSFAELYGERTGRGFKEDGRARLHKLDVFVEQTADGAPRLAIEPDLQALTPMFGAYRRELGHADESAVADRKWLTQRIERGRLWVWENGGQIVTMVGHQAPVFGAVRVGPVYTPPESRGRGYASALTAEVTRRLRDAGDQVCLNTDLANPTSNKIYAAIGYRPVQDFVTYAFT